MKKASFCVMLSLLVFNQALYAPPPGDPPTEEQGTHSPAKKQLFLKRIRLRKDHPRPPHGKTGQTSHTFLYDSL